MKRGRPVVWTKEKIIRCIRRFRRQWGHWPETSEFVAKLGMPSVYTVRKHFGTLASARRASGMKGGGFEGPGGSGRRPLGYHWKWRSGGEPHISKNEMPLANGGEYAAGRRGAKPVVCSTK